MTGTSVSVNVPDVVASKLRAVRRRLWATSLAQMVVGTAVALLAGMTAAMAMDWAVVLYDARWRTVLTVVSLLPAAAVVAVCCARFIRSGRRLSLLAFRVDEMIPSLEERCSTIVELAENTDPPPVKGSADLIRQIGLETAELAPQVRPEVVVPADFLRRSSLALAAAVAGLAILFLVAGDQARLLFRRFWAPGSQITLTRVMSLTGTRVVAKGEPLDLEARIEGRMRHAATLFLRMDKDEARQVSLERSNADEKAFAYHIKAADESFEYRFRSGDGQTPWHRVTVAERPDIAEVSFRVVPPAYSELDSDERNGLPRRCRALEGSRLEVAFRATKPVARFGLRFTEDDVRLLGPSEGAWYRYARILREDLSLSPELVGPHGLTNPFPPICDIRVYADMPPAVRLVSPDWDMVVMPDESVRIEFDATDDFGIASAELLVFIGDEETEPATIISIPLGEKEGGKTVRSSVELDLKDFDLANGDELSYAVRVRDTRSAQARTSEAGLPPEGVAEDVEAAKGEYVEGETGPVEPDAAGEDADALNRPVSQASPADDTQESPTDDQNAPPSNRPADNMTIRTMPLPGCTCSKKRRIMVDLWSGSFDGQARKKLQIAVDAYIERLKELLEQAKTSTDALSDHLDAAGSWEEPETEKLNTARQHLSDADETILELKNKSADTPYAFMGLQLDDVGLSHITPARRHLADIDALTGPPDAQGGELDQASYHIGRALARLEGLTKQYEQVKRKENLADELAHVAKVHQIFIEDMLKLMKSSRPSLNPRTGQIIEVSDEYAELLKAELEKFKKVLEELARILADDPDLLQRFLDMKRLQGTTLRDQLTLLSFRQGALFNELAEWVDADDKERKHLLDGFAASRMLKQRQFAESAAEMSDKMTIWVPHEVDKEHPSLVSCNALALDIAESVLNIEKAVRKRRIDDGLKLARELIEKLDRLDDELNNAASVDESNSKLAVFLASRREEAAEIRRFQSEWAAGMEALRGGKYAPAGLVDQLGLITDTATLGDKLAAYEPGLGRMSPEIGRKARELVEAVSVEIAEHQSAAAGGLGRDDLRIAHQEEERAAASFEKAERIFDELLTLIDAVPGGQPCPPHALTLEQLLAMLENEMKACEKLGAACRCLNVEANLDWPVSGNGNLGKGQGSEAQMQSAKAHAQQAKQQLDKLKEKMADAARQEAKRAASLIAPTGREAGDGERTERDWNVLVSRLRDELMQGRDNVPPERYRQAIDSYFRRVSGTLPEGNRQP